MPTVLTTLTGDEYIPIWSRGAIVAVALASAVADTGAAGSVFAIGVIANDGSDQTDNVQMAIDTAIYQQKTSVILPPGQITISRTIQVGYGTDFRSLVLRGQGRKYEGETLFSGTTIISTQVDQPALNIQGGREVVIEDISFVGPNKNYLHNNPPMKASQPGYDDTVVSNWVDPNILALNPNCMGRFTPLAAITIDAYAGPPPSPSYPTVNYPPQWVGNNIPQYNKAFTSDVQLNRVEIAGYVVGLCIQPCNADGNGDFVSLTKCKISECLYAISAGNSQGRNVGLTDCSMGVIYTILTNTLFGNQIGHFGGSITNLSMGEVYQLFSLDLGFAGSIVWTNIYGELVYRLGSVVGSSSSENTMIFDGGQIGFDAQTDQRGVPASVLDGPQTPIVFRGVAFTHYPNVMSFYNFFVIEMDSCGFVPGNLPSSVVQRLAYNGTAAGVVFATTDASFVANMKQTRYSRYNVDTGAGDFVVENHRGSRCTRSLSPNCWADNFLPHDWGQVPVLSSPGGPLGIAPIGKSALATCSLSGKTLSFSFTSRANQTFAFQGPWPGDIMWDDLTGAVFRIETMVALAGTATLLNNYKLVGAAYVPVTAFNFSSGNFWILNTRRYISRGPVLATGTSGSGALTNVQDGLSDGNNEAVVNDWLLVDYYTDPFWTSSSSAPQVSAVNAGAGTMTLTGTATGNFTNKLLPPFVRQTV